MGRPKRKQQEVEAARSRIVDAAAAVFAEHGYSGSTMEAIGEACGYRAASLYSYFTGKQAILDALVEMVTEESKGLYDLRIPSNLTVAQALELLFSFQFEWAERRRDALAFFLLRDAPQPDDGPSQMYRANIDQLTVFLEAHDPGAEIKHGYRDAAVVLRGLSNSLFLDWLYSGGESPLVDRAPRLVRTFLYGVTGAE